MQARSRLLFTLCFLSAAALPCTADVDFNHDGVIDAKDYTAFVAAYNAGSPDADLNGDGVLDSADYTAFSTYTNASDYRFYWAVQNPCQPGTDAQTDLSGIHIRTGVIGIGEWAFTDENQPRIYGVESGYHLMMRDYNVTPYTYSSWYSNYQSRMASHCSTLVTKIGEQLPCGSASTYTGLLYIDYEAVSASWIATNQWSTSQLTGGWHNFVSSVNAVAWNYTFTTLISYTPPSGAMKYGDLTQTQKDALEKQAWQYFAQDFWKQVFGQCRTTCPNARIGVYYYPVIPYTDVLYNPTTVQNINDELSWFFADEDFFMPDIYAPAVLNDSSLTCPQSCQSSSDCTGSAPADRRAGVAEWFDKGMAEVRRCRSSYSSSAKILPVMWWRYSFYAGSCSGDNWGPFISDTNLHLMLYQPWVYGADGAILWGYLNACSNNCTTSTTCPYHTCTATGSLETPSGLRTELLSRWQTTINTLAVPWP